MLAWSMATNRRSLPSSVLTSAIHDLEAADGIGLKDLLRRLVGFDLWQAGDVVPLQAPAERRAGEVREGGLESVEAVIQRQQGVAPEGDDDGLLLGRERRGVCLPRAGR